MSETASAPTSTAAPPPIEPLDEVACATRRLDLAASILARRARGDRDGRSAREEGLRGERFSRSRCSRAGKAPASSSASSSRTSPRRCARAARLLAGVAGRLLLVAVFFLKPDRPRLRRLHAIAQMLHAVTTPARITSTGSTTPTRAAAASSAGTGRCSWSSSRWRRWRCRSRWTGAPARTCS